jgi:ADP-ribose pyrophosphatase
VDAGESPEEAAARELKEETGLVLKDVLNISPILYSSAGCTNEAVQILHCTAEGEISAEHCEPGEDIQTFLMDKVQVERLVRATGEFEGAMIGAKTWPVLFAWF